MMNDKQTIAECATLLKLHYVKVNLENTICQAQIEKPTYISFLAQVLKDEVKGRQERDRQRRLSLAHLPSQHDLDAFDFNYSSGISKQEMKELRTLNWVDQAYNVILMGPSGTGKTFIAGGLIYEAVKQGKKAYMMTMEELITTIKMKSISPTAMGNYNRIAKADLVAIDDIMLLEITTASPRLTWSPSMISCFSPSTRKMLQVSSISSIPCMSIPPSSSQQTKPLQNGLRLLMMKSLHLPYSIESFIGVK